MKSLVKKIMIVFIMLLHFYAGYAQTYEVYELNERTQNPEATSLMTMASNAEGELTINFEQIVESLDWSNGFPYRSILIQADDPALAEAAQYTFVIYQGKAADGILPEYYILTDPYNNSDSLDVCNANGSVLAKIGNKSYKGLLNIPTGYRESFYRDYRSTVLWASVAGINDLQEETTLFPDLLRGDQWYANESVGENDEENAANEVVYGPYSLDISPGKSYYFHAEVRHNLEKFTSYENEKSGDRVILEIQSAGGDWEYYQSFTSNTFPDGIDGWKPYHTLLNITSGSEGQFGEVKIRFRLDMDRSIESGPFEIRNFSIDEVDVDPLLAVYPNYQEDYDDVFSDEILGSSLFTSYPEEGDPYRFDGLFLNFFGEEFDTRLENPSLVDYSIALTNYAVTQVTADKPTPADIQPYLALSEINIQNAVADNKDLPELKRTLVGGVSGRDIRLDLLIDSRGFSGYEELLEQLREYLFGLNQYKYRSLAVRFHYPNPRTGTFVSSNYISFDRYYASYAPLLFSRIKNSLLKTGNQPITGFDEVVTKAFTAASPGECGLVTLVSLNQKSTTEIEILKSAISSTNKNIGYILLNDNSRSLNKITESISLPTTNLIKLEEESLTFSNFFKIHQACACLSVEAKDDLLYSESYVVRGEEIEGQERLPRVEDIFSWNADSVINFSEAFTVFDRAGNDITDQVEWYVEDRNENPLGTTLTYQNASLTREIKAHKVEDPTRFYFGETLKLGGKNYTRDQWGKVYVLAQYDCGVDKNDKIVAFPIEVVDVGFTFLAKDGTQKKFRSSTFNTEEYTDYLDPNKKTLVFTHGWFTGNVANHTRFSLVDQDNEAIPGSAENTDENFFLKWIDAGYNVAIFNWNQFSDHDLPPAGGVVNYIWNEPARWRRETDGSRTTIMFEDPAGVLLADAMQELYDVGLGQEGNPFHIAGFSLAAHILTKAVHTSLTEPGYSTFNIDRIAYLDPAWNPRVGRVYSDFVFKGNKDRWPQIELYNSTAIGSISQSFSGRKLVNNYPIIELKNAWSTSYPSNIERMHRAAVTWYIQSIDDPTPALSYQIGFVDSEEECPEGTDYVKKLNFRFGFQLITKCKCYQILADQGFAANTPLGQSRKYAGLFEQYSGLKTLFAGDDVQEASSTEFYQQLEVKNEQLLSSFSLENLNNERAFNELDAFQVKLVTEASSCEGCVTTEFNEDSKSLTYMVDLDQLKNYDRIEFEATVASEQDFFYGKFMDYDVSSNSSRGTANLSTLRNQGLESLQVESGVYASDVPSVLALNSASADVYLFSSRENVVIPQNDFWSASNLYYIYSEDAFAGNFTVPTGSILDSAYFEILYFNDVDSTWQQVEARASEDGRSKVAEISQGGYYSLFQSKLPFESSNPAPNELPFVRIRLDNGNAPFEPEEELAFTFEAGDSDGTIVQFRLLINGQEELVSQEVPESYSFTPMEIGIYNFVAEVTDDQGESGSDTLSFQVIAPNELPFVRILLDNEQVEDNESFEPEEEVALAFEAGDPDGSISQFRLLVNGQEELVSQEVPESYSFTPTEIGRYELVAEVTDDQGASGSDTLSFQVDIPNGQPFVRIRLDNGNAPFEPEEEVSVTFEAGDPDGEIAQFRLLINGQEKLTSQEVPESYTFTPMEIGTYELVAVVTDDRGASGADTLTFQVDVPNELPFVLIRLDNGNAPFEPEEEVSITFEAGDPDGSIAQFRLLINGQEELASQEVPESYTFIPMEIGTYELVAVLTDDRGASGADTLTFQVDVTTGIDLPELLVSARIYPNPSSGIFYLSVDTPTDEYQLVVSNLSGRTLMSRKVTGQRLITVDLEGYPNGVYIVSFVAREAFKKFKVILK